MLCTYCGSVKVTVLKSLDFRDLIIHRFHAIYFRYIRIDLIFCVIPRNHGYSTLYLLIYCKSVIWNNNELIILLIFNWKSINIIINMPYMNYTSYSIIIVPYVHTSHTHTFTYIIQLK